MITIKPLQKSWDQWLIFLKLRTTLIVILCGSLIIFYLKIKYQYNVEHNKALNFFL